MKIFNVQVYGLEESIIASGYPMSTEIKEFKYKSGILYEPYGNNSPTDKQFECAKKLGSVKPSSGHDNFLKGCIVQFDVDAPQYWWPQFQRYNFIDFISSQSKMHRITKMDINKQCNKYVLPEIIDTLKRLIRVYNANPTQDNFEYILSNTPMGLNLTARISTNYLQLKTIYNQRHQHRLSDWREFCNWILSLPYFTEFVGEK